MRPHLGWHFNVLSRSLTKSRCHWKCQGSTATYLGPSHESAPRSPIRSRRTYRMKKYRSPHSRRCVRLSSPVNLITMLKWKNKRQQPRNATFLDEFEWKVATSPNFACRNLKVEITFFSYIDHYYFFSLKRLTNEFSDLVSSRDNVLKNRLTRVAPSTISFINCPINLVSWMTGLTSL